MEKICTQVELALASLSDSEQMMVLNKVKVRLGEKMKIHVSKLSGTALGEWVVCQKIKDQDGGTLVWNATTPNGVDAKDSRGRGVEIKCTDKSAGKASANYRNPARWVHESDLEYTVRVFEHWAKGYPGGHYWVTMREGYTECVNHVYISSLDFARAMIEWIKTHKKNAHNFGGAWCEKCGLVHRFVEYAKMAREQQCFPTKSIASQCK